MSTHGLRIRSDTHNGAVVAEAVRIPTLAETILTESRGGESEQERSAEFYGHLRILAK
jgi:hypothetical protein